ncbi:MAG: cytochrome c-type biogenesis protein CcmH [Gammaproteobacteria bacterium]|nr:cytochrome c-type biogenesis protein CcmH [Gammaproteobacteria bacterium]
MRRIVTPLLGAVVALLMAGSASAQNAALLQFDSPEQEALYQGLVRELRCTVCQNQTLLDSNSSLAQDLRRKVYDQVREGASRESLVDFMVSRYGDFVLYRPPLKTETTLLWFGPLLFLVAGGLILVLVLRQQRIRAALSDLASTEIEAPATGKKRARRKP